MVDYYWLIYTSVALARKSYFVQLMSENDYREFTG